MNLKSDYEIRSWVKDIQFREANKTKFPHSIGTVEGYAAKFNSLSNDMSGLKENLCPGCFTRSLQIDDDRHDVRALYGHDKTRVLGRKSAGTLEIREDEVGLKVAIHLMDTTDGRDTLINIRSGNLDAMSFGFLPMEKPMYTRENNVLVRNIKHAHLFEVSVVTWPQYNDTEIQERELAFKAEAQAEAEIKGAPLRLLRQRHAFLTIKQ
jgi:hypothetical protein